MDLVIAFNWGNHDFWEVATGPLVALVIGVGTIGVNWCYSAKNNKTIKALKEVELNANIIASARIKWLDEVREHTAEFTKNYYAHFNEIEYGKDANRQKEAFENYHKTYYLLKLYYTTTDENGNKNNEHIKIINKLDELNKELEDQIESKMDHGVPLEKEILEKKLKEFISVSAIYFKNVWEEAKKFKTL